jgi:C-terminal processing protease CtpA/Prc
MVVTGVVVGSPADRAGIRENDVILKIGGTEAHQLSVLTKVAADTPPGQTVPLDVYRQGHRRVVQVCGRRSASLKGQKKSVVRGSSGISATCLPVLAPSGAAMRSEHPQDCCPIPKDAGGAATARGWRPHRPKH